MEVRRAAAVSALVLLAVFYAAGCTGPRGKRSSSADVVTEESADYATTPFLPVTRRPEHATVLVLMPPVQSSYTVWRSLRSELSEYDMLTRPVAGKGRWQEIADLVRETSPKCVVLIDNTSLRLYRDYQKSLASPTSAPPAVIVMSSFLEEQYRTVANSMGIAYEVPGVILFVQLRSLLGRPIRKVGVVHRSAFSGFIGRQRKLLDIEHTELVSVDVGSQPSLRALRGALTELLEARRVDALWVLNDNVLLAPDFIESAWLPAVRHDPRVPFVVGVPSLLELPEPLGSFAMVPDLAALGVQTADLIDQLAEADWQISDSMVEPPISIETVVHLPTLRKYFGFRDEMLERVDRTIQ